MTGASRRSFLAVSGAAVCAVAGCVGLTDGRTAGSVHVTNNDDIEHRFTVEASTGETLRTTLQPGEEVVESSFLTAPGKFEVVVTVDGDRASTMTVHLDRTESGELFGERLSVSVDERGRVAVGKAGGE